MSGPLLLEVSLILPRAAKKGEMYDTHASCSPGPTSPRNNAIAGARHPFSLRTPLPTSSPVLPPRLLSPPTSSSASSSAATQRDTVLHDPRTSAAVVVTGCSDYVRPMSQRASNSTLKTWTFSSTPRKAFLGSADVPQDLVEVVRTWDPVGLLAKKWIWRKELKKRALRS